MERVGAQLVSLVVSIVLARILSPADYGIVALMTVFINVLAVFVDSGFSAALIQKKDADETDFSSVFYGQMFLCIIIYVILFFTAVPISRFYNDPNIANMVRVLGITILIAGVKNVQVAYVSRNMIFKRFFWATLGGTVGSAFLGIGMALAGLGAWALIGQSLFNNLIDTKFLQSYIQLNTSNKQFVDIIVHQLLKLQNDSFSKEA